MVILVNQIKEAMDVLMLDKEKMASVSNKSDATKWGIIILVVPPLLNLILSALSFPSGLNAIFTGLVFWSMVVPTVSLVATMFLMSFVAQKYFKGGDGHKQFFNVLAYASVVFWLTPIAFLIDLVGIMDASGLLNLISTVGLVWVFVVAYNYLVHIRKVTQKDATLVVLGGVFSYFLLQYILGRVLIGKYYKLFY
ncbi:MAG: YIP1 family protein [Patescibacteria group bacterium]